MRYLFILVLALLLLMVSCNEQILVEPKTQSLDPLNASSFVLNTFNSDSIEIQLIANGGSAPYFYVYQDSSFPIEKTIFINSKNKNLQIQILDSYGQSFILKI